jgi:predicted DCC family thiol-disulfide oxidoreductase YuxK
MDAGSRIIIFDGYCNFCSGAVMFILKRDRRARFRFAASQSAGGIKILDSRGIGELAAHSIILIDRGRVYERSTAALRIARGLRGLWPVFYIFMVLPKGWRDALYDLIAMSRYRIFGMREACFMPAPEVRDRFIGPQLPPVP